MALNGCQGCDSANDHVPLGESQVSTELSTLIHGTRAVSPGVHTMGQHLDFVGGHRDFGGKPGAQPPAGAKS